MPLSPYGASVYRDRIHAVLNEHRLLEPAVRICMCHHTAVLLHFSFKPSMPSPKPQAIATRAIGNQRIRISSVFTDCRYPIMEAHEVQQTTECMIRVTTPLALLYTRHILECA